jgi:hypothetical protein
MNDQRNRSPNRSGDIDCYAEAEAIARVLASQGHVEGARLLRDAVDSGSTANEILMRLRFHLTALEASGVMQEAFTMAQIRQLIAALDGQLS